MPRHHRRAPVMLCIAVAACPSSVAAARVGPHQLLGAVEQRRLVAHVAVGQEHDVAVPTLARRRRERLEKRLRELELLQRGGAVEAIAAGTPILCSAIPGNLGLLGADWPGAFPVGDAEALAQQIARAATDQEFFDDLCHRTQRLQAMVAPQTERAAWRALLLELDQG